MASLEKRADKFRVVFRFGGQKFSRSLKTRSEREAVGCLARLEDNLRRLELGTLVLPDGADVASFLLSDGKTDGKPKAPACCSLAQLLDGYVGSIPAGGLEQTTLDCIGIHVRHLKRVLGERARIQELELQHLQNYVDQRAKAKGLHGRTVSATTIKKEIVTLAAAWGWAAHHGIINRPFPKRGMRFPKTTEKPPFQTWQEIEHRIGRGGLTEAEQADLWDGLFLTRPEIAELLTVVKTNARHPFVYTSEKPTDSVLNNMLQSHSFLNNFRGIDDVVTTPIVLPDSTPSKPGYNLPTNILYLGPAVSCSKDVDTITKFLDVMEFQCNADRTNAVAALLTVPFRHHFPGGKPFVLVTATKSHAGKGTLIDFIRGKTAKAEILYEDKDWPMQRNLHDQLLQTPEIGVINIDNVRTDSSGRAKFIRSAFLESFITNAEIVLSSATSRSRPLRTPNKFGVLLNTNEGSLSIDMLNRSLPSRLNPTGDLTERIAKAKALLGGDVKHEWLVQRPASVLQHIQNDFPGRFRRHFSPPFRVRTTVFPRAGCCNSLPGRIHV